MAFRDPGRARLRPSRIAARLAGRLSLAHTGFDLPTMPLPPRARHPEEAGTAGMDRSRNPGGNHAPAASRDRRGIGQAAAIAGGLLIDGRPVPPGGDALRPHIVNETCYIDAILYRFYRYET